MLEALKRNLLLVVILVLVLVLVLVLMLFVQTIWWNTWLLLLLLMNLARLKGRCQTTRVNMKNVLIQVSRVEILMRQTNREK